MVEKQEFHQVLRGGNVLAERAFLASIVDSSDDATIGKTLDGTILTWNAAAEKMYGFTAEEAIGQSILILVPPDRHDEIPRILSKIQDGQRIDHYETLRMDRDGNNIHVSVTVSPIKSSSGEIVGASSIIRNISSRKRAEREFGEALEEGNVVAERAFLASIVQSSDDAIIGKTLDGTILSWNVAAE